LHIQATTIQIKTHEITDLLILEKIKFVDHEVFTFRFNPQSGLKHYYPLV